MGTTRRQVTLRAHTRGQVMVLGCIALLVMALMLMASYTVSNAVYEKIRVQSQADAQAYSVAVVEARALNVTTQLNRTIAAALVAQMSLHSWMAIATADVEMLRAGMWIVSIIAGIEAGYGCYPWNVSHCPCVIDAIMSAWNFYRAMSQWSNTVQGLESKFNDGVKGLEEMVENLHDREKQVLQQAQREASSSGSVLTSLKNLNASRSTYITVADGLNLSGFECALEGMNGSNNCRTVQAASPAQRSTLMLNTANASRPAFDTEGAYASVVSENNFRAPQAKVAQDCLQSGRWAHFFRSHAIVGNQGYSGGPSEQAKTVSAMTDSGIAVVTGFDHAPPIPMGFGGGIYSNSQGGGHNGQAHSGQHGNFKGVNQSGDPCGSNQSCFINFRSNASPQSDFGFPTTYGAVSQDVRLFKGKNGSYGSRAPWELNNQRKVRLQLLNGQTTIVDYVPRGNGTAFAIAKGKVYFHQLGNWQVAPNMFDPFWRAKLHFFTKSEFSQIVGAISDPVARQLNGAGAPVEGE